MARPIFVQGLSTILTSVLIAQFAFADLAMAQTSPPVTPNTGNPTTDPFWSNTANTGLPTDPNQSPFWFNAPANPADPTQPSSNDPWGGWTDDPNSGGWNSSGPSGDWSNTNDPYSSLNNYWGTGTVSQPNPTDSFPVQIMKWANLISKNYAIQTRDDRIRYGAYSSEDNDALANIVIDKYSVRSGYLGAVATFSPLLLTYLQAVAQPGSNLGWGYGTGMVLGTLGDFINVITQETNMMFELQEIYGELSDDPDERAAESMAPFYLGAIEGGVSLAIQKELGLSSPVTPVPPNPNPFPPTPDPNPNPGPNPAPNPVPNPPSPPSDGLQAAGAAEKKEFTNEVVHSASGKELEDGMFKRWLRRRGYYKAVDLDHSSMQFALETHLPEKLQKLAPQLAEKLKDKEWALKMVKVMKPTIRIAAAIAINYEVDYWTCRAFGWWAKRLYRPLHKVKLAKAVSLLRVNPRARTTLWLLMLRDFLPNMEDQNDAKMYASILLKQIPLVRNSKHDELKQMLVDYQADPKLIDEDLAALRADAEFPTPVKLYLIKLLYAAALMKGYPTDHELKSVDTVAVGLGLIPPIQLASQAEQLEMQNPGDLRIINKNRYYDLLFLMNKAANKTMFIQPPDQQAQQGNAFTRFLHYHYIGATAGIQKPSGYVVAQKWRSGQIILQDYQDSGVPDAAELLDEIHANQGLMNPALQKKTQDVANKLSNPAGTTGTPVPPTLQPNQMQAPVSTHVPGITNPNQPSFPTSPSTNGAFDQFPSWDGTQTPAPTGTAGQQEPKQSAPVPAAPASAPKPPSPPTGTAGTVGGTHT